MNQSKILDDLIEQGEKLSHSINFVKPKSGTVRIRSVYKSTKIEEYQDWQSTAKRFLNSYYQNELVDFNNAAKSISPDNHQKIMSMLRAIKKFPNEHTSLDKSKSSSTNITINNTQRITVSLVLDSIKSEISKEEYNALQEILKNYQDGSETKERNLMDKLKSFGSDVLSNIVANMLTNF